MDEVDAAEEPIVTALVSLVQNLHRPASDPCFFSSTIGLLDCPLMEEIKSDSYPSTSLRWRLPTNSRSHAWLLLDTFPNAAQVLAETNWTLREGKLPFTGPKAEVILSVLFYLKPHFIYFIFIGNTLKLLDSVPRVLYRVCLHDNEHFINKERFEALMEPLVEQLDNQLGGELFL